ncbi:MAG TPA: MFS transporter [Clostridia bacterium]|nr:MFS transporter [Clostridia bacterium]
MSNRVLWSLGALCTVPFVMVLGNSMLVPVLPQIKESLRLTQLEVALLLTAFSLPAGMTIPFSGMLSDMVGRKKVMIPALLVYGLGGVGGGLAGIVGAGGKSTYAMLLCARVIQGMGAGGTYQLAMALAGDTFPRKERTRVLGILEASNGIGKVASPLLGAFLALISWQTPFFLYGALAIPAAVLVTLLVREAPEHRRRASDHQSDHQTDHQNEKSGSNVPKPGQTPSKTGGLRSMLKQYRSDFVRFFSRKKWSYVTSYAAGFVCLFILFGILADFSDVLSAKYGMGSIERGLVIAVPVSLMALTSYASGVFLSKKPPDLLGLTVWGGLALMAAGLALNGALIGTDSAFRTPWWPEGVLISIAASAAGLVLPALNTLITSSVATQERGLITCLYGTSRFFGAALGPAFFGMLLEFGRSVMLYAAAFICGGVSLLAAVLLDAGLLMGSEK